MRGVATTKRCYRGQVKASSAGGSTSASMLQMVRIGVEGLVGEVAARLSKRELLHCLPDPMDAFAVGRGISKWGSHPVVRAVAAAPTPEAVLVRWQSIEAFGHAGHRTRIVEARANSVELEHIPLDGGTIAAVEDLFIWGVIAGLLDIWGAEWVSVSWPCGGALEQGFVAGETAVVSVLTGGCMSRPSVSVEVDDRPVVLAVQSVVRTDLLRGWTLAQVVAKLGGSTRSLQRRLQAEGAAFSGVVQRTRVDAALELIRATDTGLTEVAFCAGFSDHAHLTRTMRKHLDIPPSVLRALLRRRG